MNKFQLMGRLTKDPDTKKINDKAICNFSLAVNRKYVAQGQERQADFFNVVAYGKTAEFCSKYYKKGQQVLVEGRMQNRTWEDKTGQKRYTTDYIVEDCFFADSNKQTNTADTADTESEYITIEDNDELPF